MVKPKKKDSDSSLYHELYYYLLTILIFLLSYSFAIEFFDNRVTNHEISTLITALIITIFMIPVAIYFKKSKFPLSDFGFNLKNYKKNISLSVFASLIFCLLVTLLKLLLIKNFSLFSGLTIFSRHIKSTHFWLTTGLIYMGFAFLQTVIQNGFCQAPIFLLSKSPRKRFHSLLLSTLLFTFAHIDLNLIYAIAVIPAGFLWAMLFDKQKSLIGPYVSHIIIGIWAFWFLNFNEVFYLTNQMLLTH